MTCSGWVELFGIYGVLVAGQHGIPRSRFLLPSSVSVCLYLSSQFEVSWLPCCAGSDCLAGLHFAV